MNAIKLYDALNEAASRKQPKMHRPKQKELSGPVKALVILGTSLAAIPVAIIGTAIAVPTFLLLGISASIMKVVTPEKSRATPVDQKTFDMLIKEITELQTKLLQAQKSGKYYRLVYKYHKQESRFEDPKGNPVNIKSEFSAGKVVYPTLCVLWYMPDVIDSYKDFLKTFPDQDIPYYEGKNESYLEDCEHEMCQEADKALWSVGYDPESKRCAGYPHVKVEYHYEASGVFVELSYASGSSLDGIYKDEQRVVK